MKKLLLLLILSFLSAQSFAAGLCPDGSLAKKTVSWDGSYYEYKCSSNSNSSYKKSNNSGSKRLFDFNTNWVMSGGVLSGSNGIVCRSFNEYVGTCNTGVNYGRCANSTNLCGSDGTSYIFEKNRTCIRSSFGAYCCNNGIGSHSVTCNSKSSSSSSSYSSKKIPSNAVFSLNRYGFKCNYGFVREGKSMCVRKASPKKIPENAYKTGSYSSGDGWDCKGGYEKYNNGCRKKSDPENSYSLSEDIPLNSHKSGGGWECNTGYAQYGNKCVAKSTTQETKVIQNESSNYLEEIKQAKALLDSGVITQDEFEQIKKKIIDNI